MCGKRQNAFECIELLSITFDFQENSEKFTDCLNHSFWGLTPFNINERQESLLVMVDLSPPLIDLNLLVLHAVLLRVSSFLPDLFLLSVIPAP